MKKFVTLLLTAALAITAATTAFAADGTIDVGPTTTPVPTIPVTYKVDPSYTVTIPTSVTLNAATTSKATVKADGVTIPYDKKLAVTLNSSKNFYVITDEGAKLKYNVKKDNGTTPISNGAAVLEVRSGSGSTELTFALDSNSAITYSGEYKDTVTFTVGLVPAP